MPYVDLIFEELNNRKVEQLMKINDRFVSSYDFLTINMLI